MGLIPMEYSDIAIVTATSAANGSYKTVSYPTGYTSGNSVLIGLQFYDADNYAWRTLGQLSGAVPCALTATLTGEGINLFTRDGSAANRSVRITLHKFE